MPLLFMALGMDTHTQTHALYPHERDFENPGAHCNQRAPGLKNLIEYLIGRVIQLRNKS